MDNEKYYKLIERLEKRARENPKGYKIRTFLLVLLGYGYVFGVLLILLVVSGVLILSVISGEYGLFKIAIAFIVLSYYIFKGLWVKIYPPGGIPLNREDSPKLFNEVDKITRSLKSPKVHYIYITDEYNASIASVPQFGLFGFYKNYLCIGLPDMWASSAEEFRATLAHEIAHLSSKHGRSGVFIYRVRETWKRILSQLEEKEHWGNFIFKWFFKRYIPFFDAYSSVYRRLSEHEADKLAAELVGVDVYTSMMINISSKSTALNEDFWKEIYKRNRFQYKPPIDVFARLESFLKQELNYSKLSMYLKEKMEYKTNVGDTHPCLRDRIGVIGGEVKEPTPVEADAASHYFTKELLDELSYIFSRHWYEKVEKQWSKKYSNLKRCKIKFKSLEKYGKENLDIDGLYYYAYYTHRVKGAEEAIPLYKEVLSLKEKHLKANYGLGKALLCLDNNEGLKYLERVINISGRSLKEKYVKCYINACKHIFYYYLRHGDREKAKEYYDKAIRHNEIVEYAKKERDVLKFNDELLYHDLDEKHVNRIINRLKKYTEISEAYLMKKKVRYFENQPVYVLGVRIKGWYNHAKVINKIASSGFATNLDIFVFPLSLANWRFILKVMAIKEARIYKK